MKALALGSIYAMLALGFVLIFKATQVVNFAHGALAAGRLPVVPRRRRHIPFTSLHPR